MKKIIHLVLAIIFPVVLLAQWEPISTAPDSKHYGSVKFFSDDIGFLLGSQGLFLKTQDGGDTWDEIEFLGDWYPMKDVYMYGSNKVVGLAVGEPPMSYLFQVSYNSGGAWLPVSDEIVGTTAFDFQLPNLSLGYCGSLLMNGSSYYCGIYKLSDVGLNTQTELVWNEGLAGTVNHILAVDEQVVLASYRAEYPEKSFVLRSNDQGDSWYKTLQLEQLNAFRKLDVSVDGDCIYTLSGDSVFYSMDKGENWEGHSFVLHTLELLSRQEAYGVIRTSGGGSFIDTFNLAYTNDAWQTWSIQHKVPFEMMIIDHNNVVQMVNETTGYWACDDELFKTTNGGFVSVPEIPVTGLTDLKIMPNPASSHIKIEIPNGAHQGAVVVYNNSGAKVFGHKVGDTDDFLNINTSTWPAGLYQISISGKQGKVASGKVVIK
jgi:photosystem II stability/assembly factor-like uncharacterized protein